MAIGDNTRSTLRTSGDDIYREAARFKKNTSVGLDLWALIDIAQCYLDDLDKLALLLMEWF